MKKVILLSQLISMSMLFAPRDSRGKGSIAPRETPPIASRQMQSSMSMLFAPMDSRVNRSIGSREIVSIPSREIQSSPSRSLPSSPSREVLSVSGLDCAMFKHWYGDCFKTKEIDGVTYFIELPDRETKSPFVLMGMSTYMQVTSLSVSVPGAVESIFRTSNGRATRFKYTMRQKIESGEVKNIFDSLIPKVKKMRQDMIDELNDAYAYGYKHALPLDSIEVQDDSGTIYLICGIEQESSLPENYLISEPESIRIKIKASNQCPESRMSRKHLLAQVSVPTSCPEFYMSRRYLGMYHAIYSALNTELVESLKGISKFPKVEGYSQIPDSLREREWFNKAQETIEYLKENELEPSVYIPTYQHDMLAEGVGKDEDYLSLVFTCHDEHWLREFKTEVVNDLQYTLQLHAGEMKKAGLGDTFRLSDLIGKEINFFECDLYVSLFCPSPGKFKQSSGNIEFKYRFRDDFSNYFRNTESVADLFKNTLQEAKTARDDILAKLSKIKSVEFPLALIYIHGTGLRTIIASDEGNKLNPKFVGSEGPRLDISLSAKEFMTEERLIACRDVCKLVRTGIHKLLRGVTEFSDKEGYGYGGVPRLLKKQSFWSKVEALLKKVDDDLSFEKKVDDDLSFGSHWRHAIEVKIPEYQYDALIDKQHELLPFTRDEGNVFKTEQDGRICSLALSDPTGLGDTCRLSDLMRNKITNLSVSYDYLNHHRYNINKIIPGNEVSEQFKIASQTIRKLEDASGVGEAIVNISDECVQMEVFLGNRRLNGTRRGPRDLKLKILLSNDSILQKFLTKERLKICGDLRKLVRRKMRKLLKDVTEFSDEGDDVEVPELLKKQSFWSKAEALLNQIGDDVSISIPRYVHNALTDILREACDISSDSDDNSSGSSGYGNEF